MCYIFPTSLGVKIWQDFLGVAHKKRQIRREKYSLVTAISGSVDN